MKAKILELEGLVVSLPQKIKSFILDLIQQFYIAIDKLKNLSETNYNLGIFHIGKGNMRDAKMRFIFTIKLKPDFALAHYHLARCYLFDLAFDKAKQELEIALSLDSDLAAAKYRLSIINKSVGLHPIPLQVIEEDYDNLSYQYEDYIATQLKYEAPRLLAQKIVEYFRKSEIDTEDLLALDLGCGTGLVGAYLRQIVAIKSLSGVDISRNMLDLAKELEINNEVVYDYIEERDFNALKTTKKKYDIITACLSLMYSNDLSVIFTKLDSLIDKDAVLGLVFLESADKDVVFDYDNGCFAFSAEYLLKVFKKFKWEIIVQEEIKLFANGSMGFIFLLNK